MDPHSVEKQESDGGRMAGNNAVPNNTDQTILRTPDTAHDQYLCDRDDNASGPCNVERLAFRMD